MTNKEIRSTSSTQLRIVVKDLLREREEISRRQNAVIMELEIIRHELDTRWGKV